MSVTGYFGMRNIQGLAPDILPPAGIFAGTPALFRIRIRNLKKQTTSFLIRLECPGSNRVIFPLLGGESAAEQEIALTFPVRGRASIDRITISSPFPVNFFTRYWTFATDCTFIVFPHPMENSPLIDGIQGEQQGNSAHLNRGLDGELERIAPYSGNEPLRMIHWKHSARGEELLIKQFGLLSATPLIIDPDSLPGRDSEQRISCAAWLVMQWTPLRPVGLRCGDRFIPAGSGARHGALLLTELALYGND